MHTKQIKQITIHVKKVYIIHTCNRKFPLRNLRICFFGVKNFLRSHNSTDGLEIYWRDIFSFHNPAEWDKLQSEAFPGIFHWFTSKCCTKKVQWICSHWTETKAWESAMVPVREVGFVWKENWGFLSSLR